MGDASVLRILMEPMFTAYDWISLQFRRACDVVLSSYDWACGQLRKMDEFVSVAWNQESDLEDLFSAVEASIGVNLAYSVLFKLGRFTGSLIHVWAVRENIRANAEMAENPHFEPAKFDQSLGRINRGFRRASYAVTSITVVWALAAIIVAMVLLVVGPFHANYKIKGSEAIIGAAILFGAVPVGMTISGILHIWGWICMYINSRRHDIMFRLARSARATIKTARSRIRRKRRVS